MAGDSSGGAGTEGTGGNAASGGGGIAGHLPASFCLERPGRTKHRRNSAGAGNQSWRGESTTAPRANDAATKTGTVAKNDGSGTEGVLRESAMKLDCKHVWEHISEYIDKTVDAELRKEIELHLEHCEICSAILDSTRNILILTADDRTFELPVGYSERLHERLKDEIEKTKREPPVGGQK